MKLAESQDNLAQINKALMCLNPILEAIAVWEEIGRENMHHVEHYPGDKEKAKYIIALIKTRDIVNIIHELSEFIRKGKINNSLTTSPVVPAFKSIGTIRSIVITVCLGAGKGIAHMTTDEIANKLRKHFKIKEGLLHPAVPVLSQHPLPKTKK
jgi:hypothetical protein